MQESNVSVNGVRPRKQQQLVSKEKFQLSCEDEVGSKKSRDGFKCEAEPSSSSSSSFLGTLSTDTASQLDVLGHDGDTLSVDGAEVGVFKETDQVSLASLLQGHNSRALESQIGLEVLCDFTDQTLEGQLADQQLSALLVTTDLTEGHGARPVTMGLLDASSGRGTLTSGLGCQLLARSLTSGRFARGLLGTSHVDFSLQIVSIRLGMPPALAERAFIPQRSAPLQRRSPFMTNQIRRHKTRRFKVNTDRSRPSRSCFHCHVTR